MREGSKQCGITFAADREKSNADPPPDCLSGNSDHCGLVELLKCRRRQIARGLYNQPDQPDREHGPVAGSAIRRVLIEPIPLKNDRARPGRLLSGFGCRPYALEATFYGVRQVGFIIALFFGVATAVPTVDRVDRHQHADRIGYERIVAFGNEPYMRSSEATARAV